MTLEQQLEEKRLQSKIEMINFAFKAKVAFLSATFLLANVVLLALYQGMK